MNNIAVQMIERLESELNGIYIHDYSIQGRTKEDGIFDEDSGWEFLINPDEGLVYHTLKNVLHEIESLKISYPSLEYRIVVRLHESIQPSGWKVLKI